MEGHNEDTDDSSFQPIGVAAERLVSNLIQHREVAVEGDGRFVVSGSGLYGRDERTKVDAAIVAANSGDKLSASSSIDALKSTLRKGITLVRVILLSGGFPQVSNRIVRPASINVIDKRKWPLTVVIEPRQARCLIQNSISSDHPVTLRANTPRFFPEQVRSIPTLAGENSCNRIVIEQHMKPFFSDGHDHSPQKKPGAGEKTHDAHDQRNDEEPDDEFQSGTVGMDRWPDEAA